MDKKQLIVAWVVGALLLGGCATQYNKYGFLGGYEDRAVEDNIFEVAFAGNAFIDEKKAEDFALLRCAYLTIENGYRYFIVSDKIAQKVYFGTKPTITLLVQCFREIPENAEEERVYEAERIKAEIENKYKLNKNK